MKALVLGGNRFFGKRLVSALLSEGVSVSVLNRGQRPDEFGNLVQRIHLDRRDLLASDSAFQNQVWDIIYDQICYEAPEAALACSVFSGKTSRYIFTSSQSVYPEGGHYSESDFDPRKFDFKSAADRTKNYAEAKRQSETTFFASKLPVVAVRFPIVLGNDDYTERLKFHVDAVLTGKPFFLPNPEAQISFIQSADASRFLSFLKTSDFLGAINCCASEPIKVIELVREIERVTGKKAKITKEADVGEPSPFGVEQNWTMGASLARSIGFECQPILNWLPELILEIAKNGSVA